MGVGDKCPSVGVWGVQITPGMSFYCPGGLGEGAGSRLGPRGGSQSDVAPLPDPMDFGLLPSVNPMNFPRNPGVVPAVSEKEPGRARQVCRLLAV